jgi:hypothetical protein
MLTLMVFVPTSIVISMPATITVPMSSAIISPEKTATVPTSFAINADVTAGTCDQHKHCKNYHERFSHTVLPSEFNYHLKQTRHIQRPYRGHLGVRTSQGALYMIIRSFILTFPLLGGRPEN